MQLGIIKYPDALKEKIKKYNMSKAKDVIKAHEDPDEKKSDADKVPEKQHYVKAQASFLLLECVNAGKPVSALVLTEVERKAIEEMNLKTWIPGVYCLGELYEKALEEEEKQKTVLTINLMLVLVVCLENYQIITE